MSEDARISLVICRIMDERRLCSFCRSSACWSAFASSARPLRVSLVFAGFTEPTAFRRYSQANACKMKPFPLTIPIIASNHFAIANSITEAVRPAIVIIRISIPTLRRCSVCAHCWLWRNVRNIGSCGMNRRAAPNGHPRPFKLLGVRYLPVLVMIHYCRVMHIIRVNDM